MRWTVFILLLLGALFSLTALVPASAGNAGLLWPFFPAADHSSGVLLRFHRRDDRLAISFSRPLDGSDTLSPADDPGSPREGRLRHCRRCSLLTASRCIVHAASGSRFNPGADSM